MAAASSNGTSTRCVHSGSTSRDSGSRPLSPPPEPPAGARNGDKGASFSHFQYSNAPDPPKPQNDPLLRELETQYNNSAQLQHRLKH
ncbi:hypothetical protein ACHAP5_010856 [Fusarium lateritium]